MWKPQGVVEDTDMNYLPRKGIGRELSQPKTEVIYLLVNQKAGESRLPKHLELRSFSTPQCVDVVFVLLEVSLA